MNTLSAGNHLPSKQFFWCTFESLSHYLHNTENKHVDMEITLINIGIHEQCIYAPDLDELTCL